MWKQLMKNMNVKYFLNTVTPPVCFWTAASGAILGISDSNHFLFFFTLWLCNQKMADRKHVEEVFVSSGLWNNAKANYCCVLWNQTNNCTTKKICTPAFPSRTVSQHHILGKTPDGCPRAASHQSEPVDRGHMGASLGEAVSTRV